MGLIVRIVQQIAYILHTDSTTVAIAIVLLLALMLIVQFIKKLVKLAILVISLVCIVITIQQAQAFLKDQYGITFQSAEKAIVVDIGQEYDTYDKQLYIQLNTGYIWVNTDDQVVTNIQIDQISNISIRQSSDIQTINIETYNGNIQEIITNQDKANTVYMLMKAISSIDTKLRITA